LPRAKDIAVCLIGSENHKAHPDLRGDCGFWLRVEAGDTSPFIAAFKDSLDVFHEFVGTPITPADPREPESEPVFADHVGFVNAIAKES
jgi:hypothetical protein